MPFSIGVDIVEVKRISTLIDKYKREFIERVYTRKEIKYCNGKRFSCEHFASRFAAKEACVKSLSTGFTEGMRWVDIEIINDSSGKPHVVFYNGVKALLKRKRIHDIAITLSHCKRYAIAMVIMASR